MIEYDELGGFCTDKFDWCAIPYVNGQYIIIHQGSQVRLCKTSETAKNFIKSKDK